MKFNLVFENTGDILPVESIYPDLVEYYIDFLNQNNSNKFSEIGCLHKNISDYIDNFFQLINYLNNELDFISNKINIKEYQIDNHELILNQEILNKFHANWVLSQNKIIDIDQLRFSQNQKEKLIGEKLHYMFPDSIRKITVGHLIKTIKFNRLYDQINILIHDIESSFDHIRCSTENWIQIDNIFPKKYLTNNISNLNISFHNLGRTRYNKFINWDKNLSFDDENSFNELLGFVDLKLVPPQTINYSEEYKQWCNKNNVDVIGDYLNLGNLINLEKNLFDYRKIIYYNLKNNNSFSLQI